jgi:hypothetical protein
LKQEFFFDLIEIALQSRKSSEMKLIVFMVMLAFAQEPEERLGMLGMGKAPDRLEAFTQAGGAGTKRFLRWKLEAQVEEFGAADTGMVVFEKQQDWLRVKSKQGVNLWVKMPQGGQFVALPDLLEGNQIYLTKEAWDQRLSATAGGPRGAALKTDLEPGVKIVGKQIVNGKLWLQVTILDAGLCEAPKPKAIAKGWVPLRMVWYSSSGC